MACILCSIDLSPASKSVVLWAVMLAHKMDCPLRIFNAVHQPADPIHPSAEFERGGGLYEQRAKHQAMIQDIMQTVKIPWSADIVYGEPAEMVAQFCRQNAVAMVVAGSKGIKGLKRFFLGTVIERLARMLPCPLMVVRPSYGGAAAIHRIGVSCDTTDAGKDLLGYAAQWSGRFNTHLHVLHAMGAAVDSSLVEPTDGPYGEVQHRLKERLKQQLDQMVPDTSNQGVPVNATIHLTTGQAKEMFSEMAEKLATDVLMVGVRPRRTLGQWMTGSTTEAVLRKAPCHVMVVPEKFLRKSKDASAQDTPITGNQLTAVVRSDAFLGHHCAHDHPENRLRLKGIYAMLDGAASRVPALVELPPRAATMEELAMVHTRDYVQQIAATAKQDFCQLTADTYACRDSYEAARQSAGGVLAAIDGVISGDVRNVFVLNRPPGHHAENACANGFCLFNNVAVGAAYARKSKGLQKVLIVDWDLHHGNGIQHIFEEDPAVLYISTHQYPCFPGTGHYVEVGRGKGEGFTINLSLGKGWRDGDFVALFQQLVAPVSLSFNPDLILVSAGFDTHKKDPLGRMQVTEAGFAAMTRVLMDVAKVCCQQRMVLVLEGGYHVKALAASVKAVLAELSDQTHADLDRLAAKAKKRRVARVLHRTAHVLGHTWECLLPAVNPRQKRAHI